MPKPPTAEFGLGAAEQLRWAARGVPIGGPADPVDIPRAGDPRAVIACNALEPLPE